MGSLCAQTASSVAVCLIRWSLMSLWRSSPRVEPDPSISSHLWAKEALEIWGASGYSLRHAPLVNFNDGQREASFVDPLSSQAIMNRRGLITIVVIFFGLFALFFGFSMLMLSSVGGLDDGGDNQIGVIEVTGPIMESKKTVEQLRKFSKDENIKGLVVRVDSPGGAVAPSQEIFDAVRKAKAKKPLVVSMGGTAASGGYYIACGADMIFANSGSVTGSIGVITQLFQVDRILEKAKVDVTTIKTGPYKDAGSPFKPFNDADERYFNELITDIYDQFVDDVAACRKLPREEVLKVADGRVFTGRQALKLKLVDKLGTFEDAVAHVAKEAKLKGDPKLVYPTKEDLSFLNQLLKSNVQGFVQEVRQSATPSIEYRYVGP